MPGTIARLETAGYLDGRAVERLFDEHQAGAADHSKMLYTITAFALVDPAGAVLGPGGARCSCRLTVCG